METAESINGYLPGSHPDYVSSEAARPRGDLSQRLAVVGCEVIAVGDDE